MSELLKQLEHAHSQALIERTTFERKRSARKTELQDLLARQIVEEFHEDDVRTAAAVKDAQEKINSEKDRIARTGSAALFPIGQRFVYWRYPDRWSYNKPRIKTDKVAIYEIITSDSEHPANKASKAAIGSHVLRLLNKKGEPSKIYEVFSWTNNVPYGWCPEGEDINTWTWKDPACSEKEIVL